MFKRGGQLRGTLAFLKLGETSCLAREEQRSEQCAEVNKSQDPPVGTVSLGVRYDTLISCGQCVPTLPLQPGRTCFVVGR